MNETLAGISDLDSTIAAISTPKGVGGIAVIRVSGKDALAVADKVWQGVRLSGATSHTVHLGNLLDSRGEILDECVATVYKAPKSYTSQDTVEFSVHGSRYIQQEALEALIKAGARLAMPGEFTRRAFASGRLSLTRAEAVADIIASDSRAAHRLAMSQLKGHFGSHIDDLRIKLLDLVSMLELELDFAEEDVTFADRDSLRARVNDITNHLTVLVDSFRTGNAIKNGIPVAIVGPTNVGKSSLLNALLSQERAIVSEHAGTTRDTIEETAHIGDYLFRFIDTAGLRESDDPVERIGMDRSRAAAAGAHIIISVIDSTSPQDGLENAENIRKTLLPHQKHIVVTNKSDLLPDSTAIDETHTTIQISAKQGTGLSSLHEALTAAVGMEGNDAGSQDIIVTNIRHVTTLQTALEAARNILRGLDDNLATDLVAIDAHTVIDALAELTGTITTTDILTNIFSHFCIGK